MTSDYQRFLDSMKIDYMKWHDGIGYDLDALRQLSPAERQKAEAVLLATGCEDWRDVEALNELGTDHALAALRSALASHRYEVRIAAARALAQHGLLGEDEIELLLVKTLPDVTILNGMVSTLRLVEDHPTLAVRRTLLWCALHGHDDIRVHAAALIYYLYGQAAEPFDWAHRSFFLRFGDKNLAERTTAYQELCAAIQVDPQWVLEIHTS
jgi:hypothetical protein